MLLEVESAKSAAYYAGWAALRTSEELPVVASLASPIARRPTSTPPPRTSRSTWYRFTWEHDAHLYFKRAKSSELLLGDPSYHRELLASASASDPGAGDTERRVHKRRT